ncbi:MAG: hypothetical protein IKQ33_06120 [Clostridia bacterium]|nr:hypothetical protein [Clostridia bacterium]
MKKIKSLIVILLVVALLLGSSMFLSTVNAVVMDRDTGAEFSDEHNFQYLSLQAKTKSKFDFNATEFLTIYSLNSVDVNPDAGPKAYKKDRQAIVEGLIPIYYYNNSTGEVEKTSESSSSRVWDDGKIDARDASNILVLAKGSGEIESSASTAQMIINWDQQAQDIIFSLADYLKIARGDVSLVVKVTTPKIEGITEEATSYEVNNTTKFTDVNLAKVANTEVVNYQTAKAYFDANKEDPTEEYNPDRYIPGIQQIVTVTAKTKNGAEYGMVLGEDNNFYLFQTKEGEKEPEPDPEDKEFKTDLTYRAEASGKKVDGKMDKDVFLPPYYENEDKNAKKDADAVGIITSKTDEEIVATNDVALTDKNVKGNPNSEGWYYPDLNNKKVIEKEYPFDDYNNPKDNGAVKETVKLTGKDGGIDSQTPNIRWTLRRINFEKKKNDDKSITVTITYNLPIDEKSIPDGWKPIVDEDGGIRKITRTFKEGEDYKKNVTVEQNGESTATVTTPVEVKWEKDDSKADKVIPQTGAFTVALIAIVAGIAVFAYTRFRRLR